MRLDEDSHLDGYMRDGGCRQVEAPPTENDCESRVRNADMLIMPIPCNPQHITHIYIYSWNPTHHQVSSS